MRASVSIFYIIYLLFVIVHLLFDENLVVSINEFTNIKFTCTDAQTLPDGSCPSKSKKIGNKFINNVYIFNNVYKFKFLTCLLAATDGQQILDTYEIDFSNKWEYFFIIIGLAISYRIIGFIIFMFIKRHYAQ